MEEAKKKKPPAEVGNLYKEFVNLFVRSKNGGAAAYKLGQEEWKELKFRGQDEVLARINELRVHCEKKKAQNLSNFFKVPAPKPATPDIRESSQSTTAAEETPDEEDEVEEELEVLSSSEGSDAGSISSGSRCSSASSLASLPQAPTPKQDSLRHEIDLINEDLSGYIAFQRARPLTAAEKLNLKELTAKKKHKEKELKRLRKCSEANKRHRKSKKRVLEELKSSDPDVAKKLSKFTRDKPGKPRKEDEYPELYSTILKLVTNESSADSRRQSERLNSCTTLDDLTEALYTLGFNLSRSAVYLRLLPKRSMSAEGKRHVETVPVRLLRAENMARKHHDDGAFAAATIKHLKELAGLLGKDMVFYLSQDDKARVPLGLPAANKQSHILMHLQYKVNLPDHDWVVAAQHKLIPSVYAACLIDNNKVTYSGPTYVAVRSGKHDMSTAGSHALDFDTLVQLPELNCLIGIELSAYNIVERRMAPLSHDLSGLILLHDAFGNHLDSRGYTVDMELEKKNFQHAGEALAEVWSKTVIDGQPVIAEYLNPDSAKMELQCLSDAWRLKHVLQTQYCLQIVKCDDQTCCSAWRTDYKVMFPDRFLPPPVRFVKTQKGFQAAVPESNCGKFGTLLERLFLKPFEPTSEFLKLPFDFYCPTVRPKLAERTCNTCGAYFATKTHLVKHRKCCKQGETMQPILNNREVEVHVSEEEAEADEEGVLSLRNIPVPPLPIPVFQFENGSVVDPYKAQYEAIGLEVEEPE